MTDGDKVFVILEGENEDLDVLPRVIGVYVNKEQAEKRLASLPKTKLTRWVLPAPFYFEEYFKVLKWVFL